MERRSLLRSAALVGAGTAGCLGDRLGGRNGSTDDGDDGSDDGEATTDVTGTSFAVLDAACGSPTNEAAVSQEDGSVVVRGAITGVGASSTATLLGTSYDGETDRLRVAVGTTDRSTDGGAQCQNEITYRATVGFTGPAPSSTAVYHDGVRVDGTDDPGGRVDGISFEVRRVAEGVERDAATPTVDGDRLLVDGTIPGADGCETAVLDGVAVDDAVTLDVVTMADASGPCTDAVAEIDYRATVRFVDEVPRRIRVRHGGQPVAALTRGEPAATAGDGGGGSEDGGDAGG